MAREQRRLAAIVDADVVGYSRLMGRDESGTLARLRAHRTELIDPAIAAHGGRIVKTMGDGLLLEFASVVDATRCAVEVQTAMTARNADAPEGERIVFRIGVNLGDIIIDGDDIHGDGVNIAARLQEIATPGGVCVSSRVHDDVRDRLGTAFEDGGAQTLKNIARPVQVWRWSPGASTPSAIATPPSSDVVLTPPDKPSIAVLPFTNMSGDPEQEYFADGMVEEILEGSVRKASDRIRIAGQLIDVSNGMHLWADRFDGALEDVFDLQDRVTASVVGAIAPKLERAEIERAKRKPTASLNAYDYFLRAIASMHDHTRESCDEALRLCKNAMELDPDFASAFGLAARCYSRRQANGWTVDRDQERVEAVRLERRAAFLGKDDPGALCSAGFALAVVSRDAEDGAALIGRSLALDPNMAMAWHLSGMVRLWLGEAGIALDHQMCAMRLSPLDPLIGQMQAGVAHAHFVLGRHEEAAVWAGRATRALPDWIPAKIVASASTAFCGRLTEARALCTQLRTLDPALRVSTLRERIPFREDRYFAFYESGLRQAGLPE